MKNTLIPNFAEATLNKNSHLAGVVANAVGAIAIATLEDLEVMLADAPVESVGSAYAVGVCDPWGVCEVEIVDVIASAPAHVLVKAGFDPADMWGESERLEAFQQLLFNLCPRYTKPFFPNELGEIVAAKAEIEGLLENM